MRHINTVTIAGNITQAPKLKELKDKDTQLCLIRLAADSAYKKADGTWGEHPNYLDVTAWGKAAQVCHEHFGVGDLIVVQGEIRSRVWQTRDGENRQTTHIQAKRIIPLTVKKGAARSDTPHPGEAGGGAGMSVVTQFALTLAIAGVAGCVLAGVSVRRGYSWTATLTYAALTSVFTVAVWLIANKTISGVPILPELGIIVAAVVAAAAHYELYGRAVRYGGERAQAARDAKGPIQIIKTRQAKKQSEQRPLYNPSMETVVVGYDKNGGAHTLPVGGAEGENGLILGPPGSGKTILALIIAKAHIQAGHPVIWITFKHETTAFKQLEASAGQYGVPFRHFTLDGEVVWNPLKHGTPIEKADKIIAPQEWTEPIYKAWTTEYISHLTRTQPGLNYQTLCELFHPSRFKQVLAAHPDTEQALTVTAYLEQLTAKQVETVRSNTARFHQLAHLPGLNPTQGSTRVELDLQHIHKNRGVAIFELNALSHQEHATALANTAIQDTKALIGAIEQRKLDPHPFLIILDEFSALQNTHVQHINQRGRAMGANLILATQSIADILAAGPHLAQQTLDTTAWIAAGRQTDPESAEHIARTARTHEAWATTVQTEHRSQKQHGYHESGLGTKRVVREFILPPDHIATLPKRHFALIKKQPVHHATTIKTPTLQNN